MDEGDVTRLVQADKLGERVRLNGNRREWYVRVDLVEKRYCPGASLLTPTFSTRKIRGASDEHPVCNEGYRRG